MTCGTPPVTALGTLRVLRCNCQSGTEGGLGQDLKASGRKIKIGLPKPHSPVLTKASCHGLEKSAVHTQMRLEKRVSAT